MRVSSDSSFHVRKHQDVSTVTSTCHRETRVAAGCPTQRPSSAEVRLGLEEEVSPAVDSLFSTRVGRNADL